MEDGAEHGHGKVAFKVAVRVPVHDRHRVPGLHAQFSQGMGQLTDPFAELAVGELLLVPVDDLLVRRIDQGGGEQGLDE